MGYLNDFWYTNVTWMETPCQPTDIKGLPAPLTYRGIATCVKTACHLHQVIVWSASSYRVICVRLRGILTQTACCFASNRNASQFKLQAKVWNMVKQSLFSCFIFFICPCAEKLKTRFKCLQSKTGYKQKLTDLLFFYPKRDVLIVQIIRF